MKLRLEIVLLTSIAGDIDFLGGKGSVEVLEYGQNEISVGLESKIGENLLVSLKLKFTIDGETTICAATGKILSSHEIVPKGYRTQVHLSQIDSKLWNQFIQKSGHQQSRADRIFGSIKGDS